MNAGAKRSSGFWYAVATLVGSTVGVGIFGIPFVFTKAGLLPGILFLAGLTVVVLLLNLMYGEVVLRTESHHQLVGYTAKYLGPNARKIILFTMTLGVYGALLSYIIVAGTFLSQVLSSFIFFSPATFSTLFLIIGSLFILKGLRAVSRFDLIMLIFFVAAMLLLTIFGFPHIQLNNYTLLTNVYWFLPFGVIFFALSGLAGIPLAYERLDGNKGQFRKLVVLGTLIPAAIYLVFALVVMGVSGEVTSPDAITGLASFFTGPVVTLGSIFGLLAVFTCFLSLGLALKEAYQYDGKFSAFKSWLLVVIPPYILFLLGFRNFINIIGLVGGLALSIEGIMLVFLYVKARRSGERMPEYSIKLPLPVFYALGIVFLLAAAYTLIG